MALTGMALLATVIVLNAFHHNPERPVPHGVRVFVLRGLAKLVFLGNLDSCNKVTPNGGGGGGGEELAMDETEDSKLPAPQVSEPDVISYFCLF